MRSNFIVVSSPAFDDDPRLLQRGRQKCSLTYMFCPQHLMGCGQLERGGIAAAAAVVGGNEQDNFLEIGLHSRACLVALRRLWRCKNTDSP